MPDSRLKKRFSACLWRARILWILVIVLDRAIPAFAAGDEPAKDETRTVLVLYQENKLLPATLMMHQALHEKLEGREDLRIDVISENMDFIRFRGDSGFSNLAGSLRLKYVHRKIDLIVAEGNAYMFMMQYRDKLFPGVPVVFTAVDKRMFAGLGRATNSTGVCIYYDFALTLDAALRLQPDTRRIIIIAGHSEFEKTMIVALGEQLAKAVKGIPYEVWSDRPLEQALNDAQTLPQGTLILFASYLSDEHGRSQIPSEICERLARRASVPVYGLYDTLLGRGITGGYLVSFQQQGTLAGEMVLRILNGTPADQIPVLQSVPARPMFDARQLRRWDLPEALLPVNSILVNKESTVWDQHGIYLRLGAGLIFLQTALIVLLLLEHRRRNRAEQAFRRSQESLLLASEFADLGVWTFDLEKNRLRGTASCYQMLGLPQGREMAISSLLQCIHPDDREAVRQGLEEAMRGQHVAVREFRVPLAGGAVRWFSLRYRVKSRRDEDGMTLLGVMIDVTERKQSERRMRENREELARVTRISTLGELAAVLAHEINQPLGSILSNAEAAEILLRKQAVDPGVLDILADIRSEDRRANEIIRRIRTLFQKGVREFSFVQLNDLIRETVRILAADLQSHGISVQLELDDHLPQVEGDPVQLQQVLVNLLQNSLDALAAGGTTEGPSRLALRTRRLPPRHVEVMVEDNGPGLSAEAQQYLFQPFFSSRANGMGLGLCLCKTIMESHKGRIQILNRGSGGCQVLVVMPETQNKATHT